MLAPARQLGAINSSLSWILGSFIGGPNHNPPTQLDWMWRLLWLIGDNKGDAWKASRGRGVVKGERGRKERKEEKKQGRNRNAGLALSDARLGY